MKKTLLRLFVLIGLLVFAVPGYADLWSGSVNAGSGGGITASGWTSTEITWEVEVQTNGWVRYNYTWNASDPLSYIIFQVSDDAKSEHFTGFTLDGIDSPEMVSGPAGQNVADNPGMPSDLYGLYIYGDTVDKSFKISFLSKRLPMWGSFYANGGTGFDAYNTNFGGTAKVTDNAVNLIAVPDTRVPEVPVPAAVWLFGTGLLGLAGVRRRMSRT